MHWEFLEQLTHELRLQEFHIPFSVSLELYTQERFGNHIESDLVIYILSHPVNDLIDIPLSVAVDMSVIAKEHNVDCLYIVYPEE